jgi:hypothetical protein
MGVFEKNDLVQIFFAKDPDNFSGNASLTAQVTGNGGSQVILFKERFPQGLRYLRLDPGANQDTIWINSLTFIEGVARMTLSADELYSILLPNDQISSFELLDHQLRIVTNGSDPFLRFNSDLAPLAEKIHAENGNGPIPILLASLIALFFLFSAGPSLSKWITEQGMNFQDLAISTIFVFVLYGPFLASLTDADRQSENTEKRTLATKPSFVVARALEFPSEFTAYFDENFSLRQSFFRLNALFHVCLLGTSPLPDKVITGKDGWLFQNNADAGRAYRGIPLYTFEELEHIRAIYEARQQWLRSMGVEYYLMVPPLSGNFNREYLSDRFKRLGDSSWLDQVGDHFRKYSTVPLIDVRPALIEAKKDRDVYFKTDIHWNPYGAFFGYRTLIDRLQRDDPKISSPWPITDFAFRNDTNELADLGFMLGLSDILTRVEPICTPVRSTASSFSHNPELPGQFYFLDKPQTYSNPDTTLPKLLMFHDSFGLYLKPLVNEHFSRATYVWSGLFIPDAVVVEKPDIVVQEFMEMFIVNMPKDTVALTR